jgi:hypothetical protein
MRLRWPAFAVLIVALAAACAKDPRQAYEKQAALGFLFEERPFHLECADWPPKPPPPGQRSFGIVTAYPRAAYSLSRFEALELPKAYAPSLTFVTEPANILDISIQGSDEHDWELRFCAQGDGDSVDEARGYLDKVSLKRLGSLVTLDGGGIAPSPSAGGRAYLIGGCGHLVVDAPDSAPITVHSLYGPIEVHDMAGPVRLSAPRARVSVLNTTGTVDAQGFVIDFAGSKGTVSLNATTETNIKITGLQFQGTLSAYASREVRILVPRGFQGPIEAIVAQPKNLICRADFCARMQKTRVNGWYSFTFMKGGSDPANKVGLHSEFSNVVIDNAP